MLILAEQMAKRTNLLIWCEAICDDVTGRVLIRLIWFETLGFKFEFELIFKAQSSARRKFIPILVWFRMITYCLLFSELNWTQCTVTLLSNRSGRKLCRACLFNFWIFGLNFPIGLMICVGIWAIYGIISSNLLCPSVLCFIVLYNYV